MHAYSVRELREHIGDLIATTESGQMALITKHGKPVFLAVPFDDTVINSGLPAFLAVKAYQEGSVSLEKAAKMARLSLEAFIEWLAELDVPVVHYSSSELQAEWALIKTLKKQKK